MKKLIIIGLAIFSFNVFAGNCTQTTRTNYNALQVLKASDLNADLNQLVNKANAMDGGCISDGTLEPSALAAVEFSTVTNGIHQGCTLTYVDTNTVGVGNCIASVNGKFVKTTVQTNVTWGCTGCAAEAEQTQYYVYAKSGSSGTALNLLISTTVPGADGYDLAGNKVLGKFYNNLNSNINTREILSWSTNFFAPTGKILTVPGAESEVEFFSFLFQGPSGPCTSGTCNIGNLVGDAVISVTHTATGTYEVDLKYNYDYVTCNITYSKTGSYSSGGSDSNALGVDMKIFAFNASGVLTDYTGRANCFAKGKQ